MPAVRTPASSANLGAGFDVLGLALDLHADIGTGPPPDRALALDEHHPGREAFTRMGGTGPLWLRSPIPMARGLGFSGAVRVGAAALGAVQRGETVDEHADEILAVATELEGHADNAAASLYGGVVATVDGRVLPIRVGPVLGAGTIVTWIPDVTTSTDHSRTVLDPMVARDDVVHSLGRAIQFVLAVDHDDPDALAGATSDRLHQPTRLPGVPGAEVALAAGSEAGAWCGWLSGSGPTVAFWCAADRVDTVVAALPGGAHTKRLAVDLDGCRVLGDEPAG